MAAPPDIIVVLIALYKAQWNPANVGGITPFWGTGWIIPPGTNKNQIIVSGDPAERAQGATGIYGIGAGAGDPQQMVRGLAFVETVAEDGSGLTSPYGRARAFKEEIRRITMGNVDKVAGYDYISFIGAGRVNPAANTTPIVVRYSCQIGYQFRYTTT